MFDKRLRTYSIIVGIVILTIYARLFQLQIIHGDYYREKMRALVERDITLDPIRTAILDANGVPLAVSTVRYHVIGDPHAIRYEDKETLSFELNSLFGGSVNEYIGQLQRCRDAVYLERDVSVREAETFRTLRLRGGMKGARLVREEVRVYPQHPRLANLLGYVVRERIPNATALGPLVCPVGAEGLEKLLDSELRGVRGMVQSKVDVHGNLLPGIGKLISVPKRGSNLRLTIDLRYQEVLEEALEQSRLGMEARSAMGLIMDARNGDLLAVAGLPHGQGDSIRTWPPELRRCPIFQDIRMFGSVFKPFILAMVIEEGVVGPDERFFCGEVLEYGNRAYRDYRVFDQSFTRREIIFHSSNIGSILMTDRLNQRIGYEGILGWLKRFGFGRKSIEAFPAESEGVISPGRTWGHRAVAGMATGYGVSVPAVQLARAYTVFANDGRMVEPRLIVEWKDSEDSGRHSNHPTSQVIRPETARDVYQAMREVVVHGTGTRAVPANCPYEIAGKTGTADLFQGGRFLRDGTNSCSFVGLVDKRLLIVINLIAPKRERMGGMAVSPAFSEVVKDIAELEGMGI